MIIYAEGHNVEGGIFAAQRNMDAHGHSQQHSLAAPALFARHGVPRSRDAR